VIQGVLLGAVYSLFACGLSLMFGVMRIINLAHGDIAVVGAYLAWVVATKAGVSPFVSLIVILPAMLVVGYFLQIALIARSLRGGQLVPLLTTFGLAIVIQNVLLEIFSPDVRSLGAAAGAITKSSWRITGALAISWFGVVILIVAVLVLGGLDLFLRRTGLGREMRATAQDPDAAQLVGVDARAVYARATAIAVATAALAGAFLAMRSTFEPASGPTQLIYAFEAVVIGGLGSLWGTLLGSLIYGLTLAFGILIFPRFSIFAAFVIMAVVLIVRPWGLMGRPVK